MRPAAAIASASLLSAALLCPAAPARAQYNVALGGYAYYAGGMYGAWRRPAPALFGYGAFPYRGLHPYDAYYLTPNMIVVPQTAGAPGWVGFYGRELIFGPNTLDQLPSFGSPSAGGPYSGRAEESGNYPGYQWQVPPEFLPTGTVVLQIDPPEALLYIDEIPLGRAREFAAPGAELRLLAGTYLLEVWKYGYGTFAANLEVKAGETLRIEEALPKVEVAVPDMYPERPIATSPGAPEKR
jgi:hypothetical protein